jgi:hypothetical protein
MGLSVCFLLWGIGMVGEQTFCISHKDDVMTGVVFPVSTSVFDVRASKEDDEDRRGSAGVSKDKEDEDGRGGPIGGDKDGWQRQKRMMIYK